MQCPKTGTLILKYKTIMQGRIWKPNHYQPCDDGDDLGSG